MGFVHRAIVAAGVGFALAALSGCGGSGSLLSEDQAGNLTSQISAVSASLADHDCASAAMQIAELRTAVGNLNGVNGTLVSNLQQGVQTTATLVAAECPTATATSTTVTTTTTATRTTATTTTTAPTTTRPPPVVTTTTTGATTSTTGGGGLGTGTATAPATTTTSPASGGAGLTPSGGGGA